MILLWPLTTALLCAWAREDSAAALDIAAVVDATAGGTEPELAWTWRAGPRWRPWDAGACLWSQAMRAGRSPE